jgi:hypothetical protein
MILLKDRNSKQSNQINRILWKCRDAHAYKMNKNMNKSYMQSIV